MRKVYLDNAATTPLDPEVLDAMLPYMREHHGNPSAIHSFGRTTRAAVEQARRKIASLLNCSPGEIIFTSGGTEADNMAIFGSVRDLGVENLITSPIEHHAVEYVAHALHAEGRARIHWADLDAQGRVDMGHLEQLLKANPKALVSLMHANNEIGTRIDLHAVGALCRKYGALFHSDTVQTMGHYRFDLAQLPVDFITCAAHKFHGPKGIGFLFMRNGATLKPMILGGSQERNMRAGTENLYGIVGLAKAMELAYRDLDEHIRHVTGLKKRMMARLIELIPGIVINGDPGDDALYTVLSVHLPEDGRSEMLIYNLDIEGIACSGGSACSSGSNKGSHVIGYLYPGREGANVRFSFSKFTTLEEVDRAAEVLAKVYAPVAVKG
ncbi:MAG: cysteine desulfurase [Bacteroidetes bacterium]|jgi:cysteine desulfurase|nr:cysteine desulfurase [Bacteroidota bacterium]MBX7129105.1 cysteine desulfurase [Flavobacteriales bacterium]MCC6653855.1 cysteine desulfurase [Flavobacteriales bacterium]HMU13417.1 cysteine desulfurase family protein [Flavobacteriales bacterium]HMZ49190.1 cysteine desulfurase family protein [Flavobacteriales bacterium]